MASKRVQEQVERLLDETTEPVVAVIVQAGETDRSTRVAAGAAASAVARRRLVTEPRAVVDDLAEALRSGRSTRSAAARGQQETTSMGASLMRSSGGSRAGA